MLQLRCPNGSQLRITDSILLGRQFETGGITDVALSRHHLTVGPVQGVSGVALLEVHGHNSVVVEAPQQDADGQAAHTAPVAIVEKGMSYVIGPGMCFYVVSRRETTMFTVMLHDDVQSQQQQQQERGGNAQAGAAAVAGGRDDCNGAGQQQHGEDQAGGSSPERARKRQKRDDGAVQQQQERGSGTTARGSSAQQQGGGMSTAFGLLAVSGLPAWCNSGPLGVRLADLIRGDDVSWMMVANFMLDPSWIFDGDLPALSDTARHVLLVHGEDGDNRKLLESTVANRLRSRQERCFPACTYHCHKPWVPQWGSHHTKAFLLQYRTGLRVVVHTANLIYGDCNNKTQGIWWQDFPRKAHADSHDAAAGVGSSTSGDPPTTLPSSSSPSSSSSSPFEEYLVEYLRKLRLPAGEWQRAEQVVRAHDMSLPRAHLVASVPGTHRGEDLHKWGHMRMRRLLSCERFPHGFARGPLVAQFSSLGSLNDKWLTQQFVASLSEGRDEQGVPLGPPSSNLQLVWPTSQEVRNSLEGWMAGVSVPGPSRNVDKPFLQHLWCRFDGSSVGRSRAMPHIKSYARFAAPAAATTTGNTSSSNGTSPPSVAWACVASHNLSKAAWGELQLGSTQLKMLSYELGVLISPSLEAAYRASTQCGFTCTPASGGVRTGSMGIGASGEGGGGGEDVAARSLLPGTAADGMVHACEARTGVALPRLASAAAAPCDGGGGGGGGSGSAAAQAKGEGEMGVVVPLPYTLPALGYGRGDEPWANDRAFEGVDSLGRLHYLVQGRESLYGRGSLGQRQAPQ